MKIIDRYISNTFLQILLFSLVIFIVIFIIVNLIENLDKFIDENVSFQYILLYYVYYIPYIIVLVLPATVLISSLFSIGQLSRRNELIALKSSGISIYRIILPLITISFFISVFSMIFTETVVPYTSRKKNDIDRKYVRKLSNVRINQEHNLYFQDSQNRYVSIQYYNDIKKQALRINFTYHKANEVKKRIQAKSMTWEDSVWVLNDVTIRTFKDGEEILETQEVMVYNDLNFTDEDLLDIQLNPEEMDFFELKDFIKRRRALGANVQKWVVELFLKISFPFANLIIVLFGIPLASGTKSGGTIGFGIALIICFFFFTTVRVGQYFGHVGILDPLAAAWMGNVIFAVIGIVLIFNTHK